MGFGTDLQRTWNGITTDLLYTGISRTVLDLKKVGCMLIGTPTGGAINYYGSIRTFELPNSHIVAGCATRYHFKDKNSLYKSVVPDVFVDFSVDDYIIGNDPQVEWVLKNAQATTNY